MLLYAANQIIERNPCFWIIVPKFSIRYVQSLEGGLNWILCGDKNDLKLEPILDLISKLEQVDQHPTRLNPSRFLGPIITTLADYYQFPECLPPIDADPDTNGKPSDHLMVVMSPISVVNNKSARTKRSFTYRPFNEERLQQMQIWIETEDWSEISHEGSAHRKMDILQNLLLNKYHEFFPEKSKTIACDDQPFYTSRLEKLKRKKSREYSKHRKSMKWNKLNLEYEFKLSIAKKEYYQKRIKRLKKVQPKHWYRELKKMTSYDQLRSEEIIVESLKDFPMKAQAELIADKFSSVSQEYEKLIDSDVEVPVFSESEIPVISVEDVKLALAGMDTNKSNVKDDVPAKILKHFANELAAPMADVLNSSIKQGCWPDIFKLEIVTPVPKVFPPKNIDDLRNISGLLNLDKIA